MSITIRTFPQILQTLVRSFTTGQSAVTDFNTGSVIRTLLEAQAQEIERFYLHMAANLDSSISQSAYSAFNFPRLGAVAATGTVTVTGTPPNQDTPVAINRLFGVPGTAKTFVSTQQVTWRSGSPTVVLPVAATTAGASGNTLAGTITQSLTAIPGFISVTNPLPLTGGRDVETDAARQQRFAQMIAGLARSTVTALTTGLMTATVTNGGTVIETVARTQTTEPIPGRVTAWIDNGSGTASADLVAAAQNIVDGTFDPTTGAGVAGYTAAGIWVRVRAVNAVPVAVSLTITLAPGVQAVSVQQAVVDAVTRYFAGLAIGASYNPVALVLAVQRLAGIAAVTTPDTAVYAATDGTVYVAAGLPTLTYQ